MPKSHIIGVRVEDDRWAQFDRAARAAGKNVSEWLRDLGIQEIAPPLAAYQSRLSQSNTSAPPLFDERLTPTTKPGFGRDPMEIIRKLKPLDQPRAAIVLPVWKEVERAAAELDGPEALLMIQKKVAEIEQKHGFKFPPEFTTTMDGKSRIYWYEHNAAEQAIGE